MRAMTFRAQSRQLFLSRGGWVFLLHRGVSGLDAMRPFAELLCRCISLLPPYESVRWHQGSQCMQSVRLRVISNWGLVATGLGFGRSWRVGYCAILGEKACASTLARRARWFSKKLISYRLKITLVGICLTMSCPSPDEARPTRAGDLMMWC